MLRPIPTENLTEDAAPVPVRIVHSEPVPVHVADYAALAPLVQLYREEMARRTAYRFQVVTLAEWVSEIVSIRRGVSLEDPGAVADWLDGYGPEVE